MLRIRKDVNRLVGDAYDRVERSRWLEAIPRRLPNGRNLALVQGSVYVLTGLWPIVAMRSFERFTGRKPQRWLARTTGLLIASTGGVLIGTAVRQRRIPRELGWLAAAHALILGTTSVATTTTRRTPASYALDAFFEIPIALGWIARLSTPESHRTVFSRAV